MQHQDTLSILKLQRDLTSLTQHPPSPIAVCITRKVADCLQMLCDLGWYKTIRQGCQLRHHRSAVLTHRPADFRSYPQWSYLAVAPYGLVRVSLGNMPPRRPCTQDYLQTLALLSLQQFHLKHITRIHPHDDLPHFPARPYGLSIQTQENISFLNSGLPGWAGRMHSKHQHTGTWFKCIICHHSEHGARFFGCTRKGQHGSQQTNNPMQFHKYSSSTSTCVLFGTRMTVVVSSASSTKESS